MQMSASQHLFQGCFVLSINRGKPVKRSIYHLIMPLSTVQCLLQGHRCKENRTHRGLMLLVPTLHYFIYNIYFVTYFSWSSWVGWGGNLFGLSQRVAKTRQSQPALYLTRNDTCNSSFPHMWVNFEATYLIALSFTCLTLLFRKGNKAMGLPQHWASSLHIAIGIRLLAH